MMLKYASLFGAAAFLAAVMGVSAQSPERPTAASDAAAAACATLKGKTFGADASVVESTLVPAGSLEAVRHGHDPQPSVVLPRPGRQQTVSRLEHSVRSVAAGSGRVEPQVHVHGRRRLCRTTQLPAQRSGQRDGRTAPPRLCDGLHRHRPRLVGAVVGDRSPGADHRLPLSRQACDDGGGQGDRRGVLRPAAGALVLQFVFERRPAGSDGSATVPGGFRWPGDRRPVEFPVAFERGIHLGRAGARRSVCQDS